MQMEMLSIGIEGKLALWRTLQEVASSDPRLRTIGTGAQQVDGLFAVQPREPR